LAGPDGAGGAVHLRGVGVHAQADAAPELSFDDLNDLMKHSAEPVARPVRKEFFIPDGPWIT